MSSAMKSSVVLALVVVVVVACFVEMRTQCPEDVTEETIRRRVRRAELVFRGRALPNEDVLKANVTLLVEEVYKGAAQLSVALGGVQDALDVNDKLVSVIGWGECPPVARQSVMVFAGWDPVGEHVIRASDPSLDPPTTWRKRTLDVVWEGVGWGPWREWSACSASCGGGHQERHRRCSGYPRSRKSCKSDGYSAQRRQCNLFACEGALSPMSVAGSHKNLGGGEFLSLPVEQLFPGGLVIKNFAILSTLRLDPTSEEHGFACRGAVLTVNALQRRRHQPFLSLEVASRALRLVHSPGGGDTVLDAFQVLASLGDGHWHRIALGERFPN